jgi:hypothetical protein
MLQTIICLFRSRGEQASSALKRYVMTQAKQWEIDVYVDEHDRTTGAEARLHNPDGTNLVGVGTARCSSADPNVPKIGDEVAIARALADLTHQLLDAAAQDIEAVTHRPAHLSG